MRTVSVKERKRRMAARHLLLPTQSGATQSKSAQQKLAHTFRPVVAAAEAVVGLHSSDPASVYLSTAARIRDADLETIGDDLYSDPGVIRHHGMRRTIWVATTSTTRTIHNAVTGKIAAAERRRLLKVLDRPESWLNDATEEIIELTRSTGPLPSLEIGKLLPHLAFPIVLAANTKHSATANAHTRLVVQAGFDARLVRTRPIGSWTASNYAWIASDQWVQGFPDDCSQSNRDSDSQDQGTNDETSRQAKATLVDQWLQRFGPGSFTDLVWWTGMTKRDTTVALADCGAVEVRLSSGTGWVSATDDDIADKFENAAVADRWAALLPGLDPTSMGWKERDWYLDPSIASEIIDRNGNIGPTIWVDGAIVGGWNQRTDASITTEFYLPVTASQNKRVEVEINRVQELLGDVVVKPRFPSPNQSRLRAITG